MEIQERRRGFSRETWELSFDIALAGALVLTLVWNYLVRFVPGLEDKILIALAVIGLLPVLRSALLALYHRRLTVDLLASVALIFSLLTGEWLSAAFINLMLASARIFDNWTERRTENIISHLLKYRPERVKIQQGEKVLEVPLEKVRVGDLVIVESGDRVPVDGTVISGQAGINQATLTGESEQITKKAGDTVWSSTLNETGSLLVRAEKVGEDTALNKIITLVDEASRKKPRTERLADSFTAWYIGITILASVLLYAYFQNLQLILALLLVTCADDIAVAIPLGFTVGIARYADRGIIVKGADVIEAMVKVETIVTDKTGTLTQGKPRVKDAIAFGETDVRRFLALLGMAEVNSHHPAGRAIVRHAQAQKIAVVAPDEFQEIPGEGMVVSKNGEKFYAGKLVFMEKNGVPVKDKERKMAEEIKERGESVTLLGSHKGVLGFVVLEDANRPKARDIIAKTRELGVKRWIMLTGDNERVAKKVAEELGIDEFRANLTPADKVQAVKDIRARYGKLAMLGDGVNDAAALALADVSFSMGAIGSDAAIDAADVALMNDRLDRVPEALALSRKILRTNKQNFIIWGLTNAVGLVAVFAGVIGPIGASAYNFATDFLPIMNALKIFRLKVE